jgi:transposase
VPGDEGPPSCELLTARAAGRLEQFLEHVREQIAASDVAGSDETGFRVEDRLAWVRCARTGKYPLLMVHPRRGGQAIEASTCSAPRSWPGPARPPPPARP